MWTLFFLSGTIFFLVYRFKGELWVGYRYAGRAAAPLKARMLAVPRAYRDILQKYFPFYQHLTETDKAKFERKTCQFLYGKQFIPRNISEVTLEAKVLIAATAVQLTFGLSDIYLQHFNKILVYPNDYYSLITRQYHRGEVNPRFGIIVLSWEGFVDGFIHSESGVNLGLHEMAHALRLENIIRNEEYQFFDEELIQALDRYAYAVCHKIDSRNDMFLRPYACENEYEFFSVAVENFFERPVMLQSAMPDLYLLLSKLLNQDPASRKIEA